MNVVVFLKYMIAYIVVIVFALPRYLTYLLWCMFWFLVFALLAVPSSLLKPHLFSFQGAAMVQHSHKLYYDLAE